MSKPMKIVVFSIVAFVILSILVGLVALSDTIVRNSYNSDIFVEEPTLSISFAEATEMIFSDPDSEYSTVEVLYNSTHLSYRQEMYLGNDYSKWYPVIELAMNDYEEKMNGLPCTGSEVSDVIYYGDLSADSLKAVGKVQLCESLTLVGMCNNHVLIFSYQRAYTEKPQLVVVDTTNMLFPTTRTALFNFGEEFSVLLKKGCFSVDDTENYSIVYIRV